MNAELARTVGMSPYLFPGVSIQITIGTIERAACSVWNITPAALRSKTRLRPIVEARGCVMIARNMILHESMQAASKPYGKTHATVIHHKRTIPFSAKTDPAFNKRYRKFLALLGQESL